MANILDNKKFNTITNIVSTVVLVISISICANVLLSSKADIGVPKFFNYSFVSVQSNSMIDEFYEGDLIVIKRYDHEANHEYKVGDIITFVNVEKGPREILTHSIVEVIDGADYTAYATKGKHPKAPVDPHHVPYDNVLGTYTGIRIGYLGKFFDFSQTPKGTLLLIVLPAAVIIIWQLFSFLRSAGKRRSENTAPVPTMAAYAPQQYYPPAAESEKEAIIQEYLQKQRLEEAKKQQIIEEYLAKQKEIEEAEKAKAEEEKIKTIIAEFLAQQKAAEEAANKPTEESEEKTDGEKQGQ